MHRSRKLLVLLPMAPALLAACGDDNPAAASPAELVQLGSAMCAEFAPQVAEAFPDPAGPPDVTYLRSFAGELADVLIAAHDRFEEITPPEDQAEKFEALLSSLKQSANSLREALTDDTVAAEMLEQGPPLEQPTIAAAALGFEGCA